MEYEELRGIARENLGTIIRVPEHEAERVCFSRGEYTDQHDTVIEAALWVRGDRPEGSSKYKVFIRKGLENSRGGESIHSDGSFADSYCEAIEWIGSESEAFGGTRISWLDLPKKIVSSEDTES